MAQHDVKKNVDDNDENLSRKLDEKLMELHSLFEVSQTLNSSLNVNAIIDNILLTSMGKMMISKGIVILHDHDDIYRVETVKGLKSDHVGIAIRIDLAIHGPTFIHDLDVSAKDLIDFCTNQSIDLIIPIRSNNQILGFIGFGTKISKKPYTQAELNFLNSLSNIAATSIENGLMVLELQDVNRKLDKKVQELNTLFDIGKELNSTLDQDKILNLLSYAIMGEMMINKCMVFTSDHGAMKLSISKGQRSPDDLHGFEEDLFLSELSNVKESIIIDAQNSDHKYLKRLKLAGFHVVVPMQIKEETRGVIAIGEKILKADFTVDDLEFLYTLGNEAIICIENARLFEETLEKQRMEEELDIAREIQQKLLPQGCPFVEGFEIAAMNIPSRQVGGDYFDCIDLGENDVCIAIADVSGKGIPASLLMSNLQASLQALIDVNSDPCDVAFKINNLIHKNTGYDKFITFFFGMLNISEKTFTYVNAGHNHPFWLIHTENTIKELDKGGLIIGMMKNTPFQKESITLQSGDWIIMFTDGVSEAMNEKEEEFEEHRIKDIIINNLELNAEDMKNKIYDAVKAFTKGVPQSDDITLIVMKVL